MDYGNELYKTIEIIVRKIIQGLGFDYTITGKVIEVDTERNLYLTTFSENEQWLKVRQGVNLSVGDIVYIRCVKGNFSEKFIDCKKP